MIFVNYRFSHCSICRGSCSRKSSGCTDLFLQKTGFEYNAAPFYFAIHLFGIVGEPDAFYFGAPFNHHGGAAYFQVFDNGYGISVRQGGAVAVFGYGIFIGMSGIAVPFVSAIGTVVQGSVKIAVFQSALRARD